MDCSKSIFWLSTIVFHRYVLRYFMHSWQTLLLQNGSKLLVKLLFSWYLFFGFKVNKFSKALGKALFVYLNMRHKILKMLISYVFNAPISLRCYATVKVRKFKSLFNKINTFLQKTTTCIRMQAEQIYSVNIKYTCFSIVGVAFAVMQNYTDNAKMGMCL